MESLGNIWGTEKAEEITDLVTAIRKRYEKDLAMASVQISMEMYSMILDPISFTEGIQAVLLSGVVLYRELLLEHGAKIFDIEEKIIQGSSNE